MRLATCRSCGAQIIWAETESGKMNPLDARTSPAGLFAIDDTTSPPRVARIGESASPQPEGFTSHFATCPNAETHRHRRSPGTTR